MLVLVLALILYLGIDIEFVSGIGVVGIDVYCVIGSVICLGVGHCSGIGRGRGVGMYLDICVWN